MNLELLSRKVTWAILILIVLMLALMMVIHTLRDALGPWYFIGLGLGIFWAARRSPRRKCPHCKHRLPAAFLVCTSCRHVMRQPKSSWRVQALRFAGRRLSRRRRVPSATAG